MSDYSPAQERANIYTHFFGFLVGLIAVPALIFATHHSKIGSQGILIGMVVYGISYLMVFGFSTAYHYQKQPERRALMKIWDHVSIYYLIAGTYTPFVLVYANAADAQFMLIFIWSLAAAGTVFKVFFTGKFRLVSTLIYLAMGWLILFSPADFQDSLTPSAVSSIAWGGAFYSFGVIFYLVKKIPFHHAIWHLFVLAGAAIHFWGIWQIIS